MSANVSIADELIALGTELARQPLALTDRELAALERDVWARVEMLSRREVAAFCARVRLLTLAYRAAVRDLPDAAPSAARLKETS